MSKQRGHYCRICGQHKANEKFSGKGHATHICKACSKRRNKPPDTPSDIPFVKDKEGFFASHDFPLDIIPRFDFEDSSFHDDAADINSIKKKRQKRKKKSKCPQKSQAKMFLSEILADGAKPKNEIVEAAGEIGIPLQALRLAKGSLGIRSDMTDSGSIWFLPTHLKTKDINS